MPKWLKHCSIYCFGAYVENSDVNVKHYRINKVYVEGFDNELITEK